MVYGSFHAVNRSGSVLRAPIVRKPPVIGENHRRSDVMEGFAKSGIMAADSSTQFGLLSTQNQ